MTICIGMKLTDRVILAADGRLVTEPDRHVTDDCQKLTDIHDTLWAAPAGNLTFTSYLIGLMREHRRNPCGTILASLQTLAWGVFQVQQAWYRAHMSDYKFLGGLLLAEYDRSADQARLWAWKSDTHFAPLEIEDYVAVLGGTEGDKALVIDLVRVMSPDYDEGSVKRALAVAVSAVAMRNEDIGPSGHIVTIRRDGAEIEPFSA